MELQSDQHQCLIRFKQVAEAGFHDTWLKHVIKSLPGYKLCTNMCSYAPLVAKLSDILVKIE